MTGIRIRDSTNIADGVKLGLRMIRDRKYKNPVACMFVLTDG
jgi:Mg-chelatase subunit ChlD